MDVFNPLPNNKCQDWSKLIALSLADNKINENEQLRVSIERLGDILG